MTWATYIPPSSLDDLSPEQQAAVQTIAEYFAPQIQTIAATTAAANETISHFGTRTFYVPETGAPIVFEPHQPVILELMFNPALAAVLGVPNGYQTMVFSTVKKSGKTTIAALAARWVAECWGNFNEVYSIANDREQSRGRVYAKALQSIMLDPRYDRNAKEIPDYWRIIEREATHLPSGSYLRAVSNDYKGEAGSNPTATFWSELWGYTLESSRRLWDEMTPVPTRPRSIRFVETYAGFENESTLLISLYEKATTLSESKGEGGARRVTREDLFNAGLTWPFSEERDPELPLFVNPTLRSFAYWDEGPLARRMPWQTREYYAAQATEMRPEVFDRLHSNFWVSSVSTFIPKEWWTACSTKMHGAAIAPLDPRTPIVVAADASVSGDCTALVAVSRNPDPALNKAKHTVARLSATFTPPKGGTLNYNAPDGLKDTLRRWIATYNVVELAYDPYQLHDVMTQLRDEGLVWTRPFSQGDERMVADFGLYTDIRDRHILDDTGPDESLTAHLQHCAAKIPKDSNTKLRIVKKAEDAKIDNAVTLSMANFECKRLLLE